MSRIGRKPVPMPANVKVSVADSTIQVEGPKGKLAFNYRSEIDVKVDEAGARCSSAAATTSGRAAPCTA